MNEAYDTRPINKLYFKINKNTLADKLGLQYHKTLPSNGWYRPMYSITVILEGDKIVGSGSCNTGRKITAYSKPCNVERISKFLEEFSCHNMAVYYHAGRYWFS